MPDPTPCHCPLPLDCPSPQECVFAKRGVLHALITELHVDCITQSLAQMCLVDTKRAVPLAARADLGLPSTTYYYDAHFLPYSAEVLVSSHGDPAGALGRRQGGSNSSRDNSQSGK